MHPNSGSRRVLSRVKEQISPDMYVDRYDYFDGLGRIVQTITLGEDSETIVSKQFYDETGRVEKYEGPFFGANNWISTNNPVGESIH